MMTVGYMPMPAGFRYKAIFEQRKPEPTRPQMDTGHRAKIFAPFAALRGFDMAILSKDVQYLPRRILDGEDQEELNRRLGILHNLTFNGRMARANKPVASVTYFVPCADHNHEAFGIRGTYTTIKDIVWNVDYVTATMLVGNTRIRMADIAEVQADKIFDTDWEYDAV